MNLAAALNILLYVISFCISVGVSAYAWRRRSISGVSALVTCISAQAFWTLGNLFELLASDVQSKVFWDNLQFIGMFVTSVALFVFALQQSMLKPAVDTKKIWIGLLIIPAVSMVLIFSDPIHGWIRPEAYIIPGEPFDALEYEFNLPLLLMFVYSYLTGLPAVYFLIRGLIHTSRYYRNQLVLISVGFLVLLVGSTLPLTDVRIFNQRDFTPISFGIGNLFVAWGLTRYRLFDIVPVARSFIIKGLSDCVVVLDDLGRVIDLNLSAQAVLNLKPEGAIGRTIAEVYPKWAPAYERFHRLDRPDDEVMLDVPETVRCFEVKISPLRGQRGRRRGSVIVARDITEKQHILGELSQRTEALEEANRRLMELDRVKDEFIANVSHELRSPISSIMLYQDLLSTRPERLEECLPTMQRETKRLESLIENLLAISILDQQQEPFTPTAFDLNSLVTEYVEDRKQLAESMGIDLVLEVSPDLPVVIADRDLLGQVLSILLTNSLNYTPLGGWVVVKTQVRRLDNKEYAGFSVHDSGPGLKDEEREKLFSRFFRGEVGRASGVSGTGLGLAIAKEIVERHHGRIEAQSGTSSGEGAMFFVWLPTRDG